MTEYYDLSVLKNQNEIATHLSNLFTIDELECIDKGLYNYKSLSNRDISEPIVSLYDISFKSPTDIQKKLIILDVINIDVYPVKHYIDARITKGNSFQIDFKCRRDNNILTYIASILSKAINFSKHKSITDTSFTYKSIIDNFATKLANISNIDSLEELRLLVEYAISDKNIISAYDYYKKFIIDSIDFKITSCKFNIMKFRFKVDNDNKDYILLPRTKIGTLTIPIIIEKAISIKESHSL